MATNMGLSPEFVHTDAFPPDKGLDKSASSSMLIEQLRSRVGQHRSWNDSIKAIRMAVGDKRNTTDATVKNILQSCLDKLHRAMKITNQQSLIERLDLISRQLGMIFTPPFQLDNQVTLSSEMFKVIIVLEGQNGIKDVKVGHQEITSSCKELVEVLHKRKFDEFVIHLQGLLSIYSIAGDKKQKTKGYLALTSLETDLNLLSQLQSSINGVTNYIHKSNLGILLRRRGGQPMKLIYYVSPYDLLCRRSKSSYPMTVEAIVDNDLGHSVTICLESTPANHKLQTIPLMSVKTNQDGKGLPSFQVVNSINSHSLPACFVLVLSEPIPLARSVIDAIQAVTGLDLVHDSEKPFLSVLLQHASNGLIGNTSQLFVTLMDQRHVYFLNKGQDGLLGQPGALVSKIPFTHPTNVSNILSLLRQQLTFNSVITSLVRPQSKKDFRKSNVFELTAVSITYLSVMFEHPLQDAMISVEFDLSDITSVQCHVLMSCKDTNICSGDFVSRTFQRCFSVPVTLRCLINQVREQVQQMIPPEAVKKQMVKARLTWSAKPALTAMYPYVTSAPSVNSNQPVPLHNAGANMLHPPTHPPPYPLTATDSRTVYPSGHNPKLEMHKYRIHVNKTFSEPVTVENYREQRPPANPLLATLLDAGPPAVDQTSHIIANESPMLSKLLEDNTSVASNPFPAPNSRKRLSKHKPSKDMTSGKSPKHRLSDSDMAERTSANRIVSERHGQGIGEKHIDVDCSGMNEESVRSSSVSSLGGHSTGSIIDLTDIGESHVKKLENSLDSIMGREPIGGMIGMSHTNNQMVGMDMLDLNMHLTDIHHNPNSNPMISDSGGGEFHPPIQWTSRQTPPTPTSRNSPHDGAVPKNEKTSTSLEELVRGPGGREIDGPNLIHMRHNSQQFKQTLNWQNSLGRNSLDCMSPDVFLPATSPSHTLLSPIQLSMSSPNYIISPGSFPGSSPSQQSHVMSSGLINVKTEVSMMDSKSAGTPGSHIAANVCRTSGKPSLSMLKAQLDMKNDIKHSQSVGAPTQEKDFREELNTSTSSQPTFLKLKLSNIRQYESMSPADSDGSKSRTSAFDFHSDDEDFTLPMVEKMAVVSATPTRLQITNKSTLASFNKFNKSEKYKRKQREKEMKSALSVDSGKRKRDKEESRKERKKRKVNNLYCGENEIAEYKAMTVEAGDGNENNQYKPMPKLKITKRGVKMLVENTAPTLEQVTPLEKVYVQENEPPVKIEKDEKSNKKLTEESSLSSKAFKDIKFVRQKEKVMDIPANPPTPVSRASSASDEGIFDRINAMKNENVTKCDSVEQCHSANRDLPINKNCVLDSEHIKKSKSEKSHKNQQSNTIKSHDKNSWTATIKLKPIVIPTSSVAGISLPKNMSPTSSTPSIPTSVAQSPTLTTIGKIGAVSLATSGSQKPPMATNISNKSPQNSNLGNKTSLVKASSSSSLSKSNGNLPKNIQIQGLCGKNSPSISQSGKTEQSRSLSASMVNSSSNSSKSDKSTNKSVSSINRTSSPLSEKERSKSSLSTSHRSNSRDGHRDREKSTSSNKAVAVPEMTVTTHETAASVLSFLNPKANKIASLPPIPKLSSNSSNQKISTPSSSNSANISQAITFSQNSVPVNVKSNQTNCQSPNNFAKGSLVASKYPSANISINKNNFSSSNTSKGTYTKGSNNSYSNSGHNKHPTLSVSSTANSNKVSSNSPSSNLQKSNSGPTHKAVKPPAARNHSTTSSLNKGASIPTPTEANSTVYYTSNSHGIKQNDINSSNKDVSMVSSASSGIKSNYLANSYVVSFAGNRVQSLDNSVRNCNFRGSNSGSSAQGGPGPPLNFSGNKLENSHKELVHSVLNNQKVRKGSLSTVIDKLTCKVSGPTDVSVSPAQSIQKVMQDTVDESPASPEMDISFATKVTEDKKVVISEPPASPEPDSSSVVKCGKISNRLSEIVSIPLEINSEESPQSPNFSDKPNICSKNRKSNAILNSSPKIIPLNSPNDKLSIQNHTASSNYKKGLSKQNNIDQINSSMYLNGEVNNAKNKLGSKDSLMNVQLDLCSNAKDAIVNVSTPKMQEVSENCIIDVEISRGHKKSQQSSNSITILNSDSPLSSPDNGLVIDCPTSPRLQNKANSQCNFVYESLLETQSFSNFFNSPKMTSKLKGSPGDSSTGKDSSSNTTSPGFQDDGLMDEALGLGN